MGTTESRVNEWPSSHVNPLFQSLSSHEFSAFILTCGGAVTETGSGSPGSWELLFWNVPPFLSKGFSTGMLSWNKSNKSLSTGPDFDKMLKTNKYIYKPFFVILFTLFIVLLEAFESMAQKNSYHWEMSVFGSFRPETGERRKEMPSKDRRERKEKREKKSI